MKILSQTVRHFTVVVSYTIELAPMDVRVEPCDYKVIVGTASLGKGYVTTDVLASALDAVDVPDGVYAVRTVINNISYLTFMLVAGNNATELVTPGFVMLQGKPHISVSYTDMQATCDLLLCNMWTGEVTHVSGYVVIDEATRSIALSSGITRLLSDCTYCAKVSTCAGSYLVFFRVQHGAVKYLHAPVFVARRGY
jgi:hypothetical protein